MHLISIIFLILEHLIVPGSQLLSSISVMGVNVLSATKDAYNVSRVLSILCKSLFHCLDCSLSIYQMFWGLLLEVSL